MISQLPLVLEGNMATPDGALSVSISFWFHSFNPSPSGGILHTFHLSSSCLCLYPAPGMHIRGASPSVQTALLP